MRLTTILLALVTVSVLSGCGKSDNDRDCSSKSTTVAGMTGCRHHNAHGYTVSAEGGSIYVHKNDLVIRADKGSFAIIHPDTTLSLDGSDVPVSDAAHKALNGYRAAYKALAEEAISLGLDGIDLGLGTVSKVMKGLIDGTADEAGKETDRRGKEISRRALGLCSKLSALRIAQQNVVELVPKFADYAVIDASEVKDCYDDNHKDAEDQHKNAKDVVDEPTPPAPPTPPASPTPPSNSSKTSKSYNFNIDSGNWSVRHGSVLIPLDDDDDKEAAVSSDGSLHIGEKSIDISSAGREALVRYHQNALKVENEGVGLGLAGVDIALGAVGNALHGVFGGDTDKSDKDLEHRGDAMNVRVKRLCGYLGDMRKAQQEAVEAIPEFKPYAVVTEKDVLDCGVDKKKAKGSVDSKTAT